LNNPVHKAVIEGIAAVSDMYFRSDIIAGPSGFG
jgi:hypothetical protein